MYVEQLRNEVSETVEKMRGLRDQVRLELHLAGMEARQEWAQMERRVELAERKLARDLSETSRRTWDELSRAATAFRDALRH